MLTGRLHALVSDSTNDKDLNPFPVNTRIKEGTAQRINCILYMYQFRERIIITFC